MAGNEERIEGDEKMKTLLFLLFLLTASVEAQNQYGTVAVWFWKNDYKEESDYKIHISYVLSSNPKVSFPTFSKSAINPESPQSGHVFNLDPRWDAIQIRLAKDSCGHRATPIQGKYSIIITTPKGQRTIDNVKWYNENNGESDILFEQLTSEIILTR